MMDKCVFCGDEIPVEMIDECNIYPHGVTVHIRCIRPWITAANEKIRLGLVKHPMEYPRN